MFSYQSSLLFAVCSSDSFNRLSHRFLFVNNFFKFFHPVCRQKARRISSVLAVPGTKHFLCIPAAAKPRSANLFCFVPVPSATKTILPLPPVIVNVFLVFYLFHAIQTTRRFPALSGIIVAFFSCCQVHSVIRGKEHTLFISYHQGTREHTPSLSTDKNTDRKKNDRSPPD